MAVAADHAVDMAVAAFVAGLKVTSQELSHAAPGPLPVELNQDYESFNIRHQCLGKVAVFLQPVIPRQL